MDPDVSQALTEHLKMEVDKWDTLMIVSEECWLNLPQASTGISRFMQSRFKDHTNFMVSMLNNLIEIEKYIKSL